MEKICSCCNKENESDNFLCSYCGFYLDMAISLNEYGLPEIKDNKK